MTSLSGISQTLTLIKLGSTQFYTQVKIQTTTLVNKSSDIKKKSSLAF